ncbi:MAG TPA: hypothetical protein VIG88_13920 [Lysobacter sp.]
MQFTISVSTPPDVGRLEQALVEADPSAMVDFDACRDTLRVATLLPTGQVAALLSGAGLPTNEAEVTRVPSECCGGCGG